jgi:hypothetical protein
LVSSYYVTIAQGADDNELLEERVGSKISLTGSQINPNGSSQLINVEGSQDMEEEEDSSSESSSNSGSDEGDDTAAAGIEDKLIAIKDSEMEDPSLVKLKWAINYALAFVVITLISALIACNVVKNPVEHFEFLDQLSTQSLVLNDIIYEGRFVYYSEIADQLLDNMRAAGTPDYWPCTLGKEITVAGKLYKKCEFAEKYHPEESLHERGLELKETLNWFTEKYFDIRQADDSLDSVYNGPFNYSSFDDGNTEPAVIRTASNWPDFVQIVLNQLTLLTNTLLKKDTIVKNSEARQAYQFIETNRNVMVNRLNEVQDSVFVRIREIIATEVTVHLIFTLIMIVFLALLFFFGFVPVIRKIQTDRLLILKLLLLIPKHVVFDFVYTIYRDADDEDEMGDEVDDKSQIGGGNQTEKELARKKALKMRSEESVDVLNDNVYGLYYFYGFFLASICLPLIIHVAWRYSFNSKWSEELNYFYDATTLFSATNALTWRAVGLWGPREFRPAIDATFSLPMAELAHNLHSSADAAFEKYFAIQKDFAGDDSLDTLLYKIDHNTEILSSCQDKKTITVEVKQKFVSKGVIYEEGYPVGSNYTVKAKESRCNDAFKANSTVPPELHLPPDFSIHTTHGVGLYLRSALESAWILGQTPGWNTTTAPTGPINKDNFWYLYEAAPNEGKEGVDALKEIIKHLLLEEYNASRIAFNATYAVTLVYSLILFIWVFARTRTNLVSEARHNRGSKFFI